MSATGLSARTRRQERQANRLGLLVVFLMLFSLCYAMVGAIDPVAAAQPDCPAGEEYDRATQSCVPVVDVEEGEQFLQPTAEPTVPEDEEEPPVDEEEPPVDEEEPPVDEEEPPYEEPEATGWIDIYKYDCPSSAFVPGTTGQPNFEECSESFEDYEFSAWDDNGQIDSGSTGGSGSVSFTDLAGQISIVESVPEGYGEPWVFCGYGSSPDDVGQAESYQVQDGSYITVDFDFASYYECYWYNFPAEDYGITIYKYICDPYQDEDTEEAGRILEEIDVSVYQEVCTGNLDEYDPFSFELADSTGFTETQTVGDEIPDGVVFDEFEPGQVTITEAAVAGFTDAVVFCGVVPPGNEAPLPLSQTEVDNLSITVDVPAGEQYVCHWFNIYEPSGIVVIKFECTAGWMPEADAPLGTYAENCQDYHDGVGFELQQGGSMVESGTTGDFANGTIFWDGVGEGEYTLVEDVPEGYGEPYIYCTRSGAGMSGDMERIISEEAPAPEAMTDGRWDIRYEGTGVIVCYVFNIPMGDGYIDVYKWICDPEYDYAAASYEDLLEDCRVPHEGVEFEHEDPSGTDTGTTDADGYVRFDSYEPGSQTITETVPDGYELVLVWCSVSNLEVGEPQAPFSQQISDGGVTLPDIFAGHGIRCDFFNVGDRGPTIDIYKYECPADWDHTTATEYTDYEQNCTTPHDGVTFQFEAEDGAVAAVVTGTEGSGRATFSGYTGTVGITEEVPDGYELVAVYCSPVNDLQTFVSQIQTMEVTENGWTLEEVVEDDWICVVYNVPTYDTTIEVYKWVCPEGWTPTTGDYNDYSANCTQAYEGVDFSLWDSDDNSISSGTTDADGFYRFANLDRNDYRLAEAIPPGYGAPVVFCFYEPFGGEEETPAEDKPEVTDASVTYHMEDGDYLVCHFYNTPEDHDIVIVKYICPYGFDWEHASYEDLLYYCEVIEIPVDFGISKDGTLLETQTTGAEIAGQVIFDGYTDGPYTVTEEIPEEFEDATRVWCTVREVEAEDPVILYSTASDSAVEMPVTEGSVELTGEFAASADVDYSWYCDWFNFQGQADDNTVTIRKWMCPVFEDDVMIEDTQEWLLEHCTTWHEGVTFTLDDLAGPRSLETDSEGLVEWTDVNNGPVTITEEIPDGYGQPSVFCGWTAFYNGAVYDAFPQKVDAPNGVWTTNIDIPNTTLFCDWFNFPDQPGDITIYKYWCPEGYDLYAWGANPAVDCTVPGEDVTFSLDGDAKQTDSEGVVSWGELDPGTYTVTETYPDDTDYSFVLKCYGGRFAGIQPYPLQFDPELEVYLVAGDHIYCYWYNVPDPDYGWITVYKYWCSTKTYASEVDCEIYEEGMTFQLYPYGSDSMVDEKTTSQYGELTFAPLEPGDYTLEEQDWEWCAIDISNEGPDNSIRVTSGQETVVKVFNCEPEDPGTKQPPKKAPPKKYPNTGADPSSFALPGTGAGPIDGGDMALALLAALAALTLAAGGLLLRQRTRPDASPEARQRLTRRTVIGAAVTTLMAPVIVAAQDGDDENPDETESDAEGTPEGTPDVPQCREDATPDPEDPNEDPDCIRGEVPKHIAIEVIGVDADIEIQEIIAGEMQDPTGPTLVTWYKETSRLGERGNGVYAGHLNYWGVPEGVFYAIKTLQPGDEIVLTGENDEEFVYAVQRVENQPGQDEPDADVLGLTEEEAITLITCGGEWDTTIAEYNERTTVRAIRTREEPEA